MLALYSKMKHLRLTGSVYDCCSQNIARAVALRLCYNPEVGGNGRNGTVFSGGRTRMNEDDEDSHTTRRVVLRPTGQVLRCCGVGEIGRSKGQLLQR